jgi:haloalkane dehalogenase
METLVCPVTWKDWPDDARNIFQAMRSDAGEKIILEKNVFIEKILPNSVLRDLSEEEMETYRNPFPDAGERRRPMLSWPREIPVDGEPAEVVKVVKAYGGWLQESGCPKLFINAEPGSILVGPQREFCRSFPNQREVTVRGLHFIQEDSPDEIGRALNGFIRELRPAV